MRKIWAIYWYQNLELSFDLPIFFEVFWKTWIFDLIIPSFSKAWISSVGLQLKNLDYQLIIQDNRNFNSKRLDYQLKSLDYWSPENRTWIINWKLGFSIHQVFQLIIRVFRVLHNLLFQLIKILKYFEKKMDYQIEKLWFQIENLSFFFLSFFRF